MKGIILSTNGKKTIILSSDGAFHQIPYQRGHRVGRRLTEEVESIEQTRRNFEYAYKPIGQVS